MAERKSASAGQGGAKAGDPAGSILRVLVLNGPNLNLLGIREPEVYGVETLADLTRRLDGAALLLGEERGVHLELVHVQANSEGSLIEHVHAAAFSGCAGAIVNAAGYTHTSVALRDALVGTELPFVEVHLSNVHAREPFRHRSLLSDVALGVIVGFGPVGYELALQGLLARLP